MREIRVSISMKSTLIALVALACMALLSSCGGESATSTPLVPTETSATSAPTVETGTTPTQMGMDATPTEIGILGETPTGGLAGGIQVIEQDATTPSYKLHLRMGEPEKMMSPQEAKGATSGEVMVSGEMAMGTGGTAPNYHLEVAVSEIKSGAVITDKSVSIELTNAASKETMPIKVATMYGVEEGPGETHFGNNLALAPGSYTVKVNMAGETAEFMVTIQQGGGMPSGTSSPAMGMPEATATP